VFDAFTDFDHVVEHALDTIDPSDQVTRSGWVGFHQQICLDLLVGGEGVALDDEACGWSGGFRWHQAEADAIGLARMSAMLSGKMTPLVEDIELHEEP
jgi:Fe-S oxidoreductase